MKNYTKHFLMNKEEILDYLISNEIFKDKENLEINELSDGNINYVFRIYDKISKKSIVVKQSDEYLRTSHRNLDPYRSKIEKEILEIEYKLSNGLVPKIYHYDENLHLIIMEDISEYKNLRKELMNRKIFNFFANDITEFIVNTTLCMTDLVLDKYEKKENVKLFINKELCDITEDLVFTEPYYNYKNRNIITKGNEEFVEKYLYKDEKLHTEIAILRNNFMNNSQSLIHGDLHSGSIFINENGIKVIDPEFAFYGPIGYDMGNVIGNLFFALFNSKYTDKNEKFIKFLNDTISNIYNLFKEKLYKKYDEIVEFKLYKTKDFKIQYITKILEDTIGYAGTEIIRRIVGDSKVLEVNIDNVEEKLKFERELIKIGIYLIKNRKQITKGEDLVID